MKRNQRKLELLLEKLKGQAAAAQVPALRLRRPTRRILIRSAAAHAHSALWVGFGEQADCSPTDSVGQGYSGYSG